MGLISRVSSRTYRSFFNFFKPKTWEFPLWSSALTKATKSPNSLATRTARAETKVRKPKNPLSFMMSSEKSSVTPPTNDDALSCSESVKTSEPGNSAKGDSVATPPLNESEKRCKTSSKPRNELPSTKFKKITICNIYILVRLKTKNFYENFQFPT